MSDVFYSLTDENRYVYHYTKSSTLTDHILQSSCLRFSRFLAVNDPREYKNWVFNFRYADAASIDFELLSVQLNDHLKHFCRIGCFSVDPYEALVTKAREDRGEDVVNAIYERGHSRPPMWAHYGENYRGACLILDKAKLDTELRSQALATGCTVYSGAVAYRNPIVVPNLRKLHELMILIDETSQVGIAATVRAHMSRHWKELFFLKARDWAYEREYRWLVIGNADKDVFVNIENALVGIVLGDHFPRSLQVKVGQYAKESNVGVAIMNWKNGFPQPEPSHWRLLIQST